MKNFNKHIWIFGLAFIIILGPRVRVFAQGDGGTRSIFSLGAGSRAISLGRSYVSLADDASALYWNPAALRNVEDKQLMIMYMPLFGGFSDATYSFFGAVYPTLEAGAFGLGFMRISDKFQGYDRVGLPTQEGEYSESQFIISYAAQRKSRYFMGTIALGASFKIANVKLSPYSSTSPGIDIGFRFIPDFARSISIGINLQDISGPKHKLVQTTDRTYKTIMAGLGYQKNFENGSALRLMVQTDMPEKADRTLHTGAEYIFAKYLALRLGTDDGGFTFGFGVNAYGFGLDYASFSKDGAGSSRPMSFTTHYGKTLYEQRRIIAEQRAVEEQELIKEAFFTRIQSHREKALGLEKGGNIPRALDEWKIVLEYMPGDSQAVDHMESNQQKLIEDQEKAERNLEIQARISTHFSQGLKFYSDNDYPRARDEWREILKMDPRHLQAKEYFSKTQSKIDELISRHRNKAREYEQNGRLTEAIGEWNNVSLLDPGNEKADMESARIRARIDLQSKDYRAAERKLRIVNLYNNALQEFNKGEYDKAFANLNELLRLDPGHIEAKGLRIMAKRKLTPLTKDEEAKIRQYYLKGMQFFSKDLYKEAILEWEKILKIDPGNESVKRNIQEADERLKKLKNQH